MTFRTTRPVTTRRASYRQGDTVLQTGFTDSEWIRFVADGSIVDEDLIPVPSDLTTANPGLYNSLWSAGNAESLSRLGLGEIGGTSGRLSLTYVIAPADVTINTLAIVVAGTARASQTMARMAIFEVADNGDLTLVARTANDTEIGASTYTAYQTALDTAGGYPASYTFHAGRRYAFGWLSVAATPPSLRGQSADLAFLEPYVNKHIDAQTDIQASYLDANLTGFYQPLFVVGVFY